MKGTDFILNGVGHGDVADRLLAANGDPNMLRPWSENGKTYITQLDENGKPRAFKISNTATSIRRYDWQEIDKAIIKAARPRLKAVADIRGAGLTYNIPNGMGRTVLQTETMNDPGAAVTSMDGLRRGSNVRPEFEQVFTPLPITHFDFSFTSRQILASRNGGSPLDTTMAEVAGRRVAERIEQMTLGEISAYQYGGGYVYGLTTYTNRNTRTITAPTADGWAGSTLLAEVLAMRQDAKDDYHFGPYTLYFSAAWDQYLDKDYTTGYPKTIRERLGELADIENVKTLDYLENFDVLLVQMTSNTVRMVVGMEIVTVQWDSSGGMLKNFKVMAIIVPQIRGDHSNRCGVVHGSTA